MSAALGWDYCEDCRLPFEFQYLRPLVDHTALIQGRMDWRLAIRFCGQEAPSGQERIWRVTLVVPNLVPLHDP
jgi:hypothetical protein